MSAQLVPALVFQGIGPTGAPLAAGKLFSYVAGTTTPQATYVDATQTTPNTNPVILNSMGQANVWVNPAQSYKFALQDAAGNPQYTVDSVLLGIQQIFPPSAAEISAGIVPTNTGYPWGDVRRYGAVLDGATDCVAALIQACTVGGAITVPGSMALASASLAVLANTAVALKSNTTIRGIAGYPALVTGTAACNVFWSINPVNIEFYDFFCIGNGASSATTTTGYFWYQQCTAGAIAELGHCCFDRSGLANFAGLYWIYVDQTAAVTFPYVGFRADANSFISQPGNCQPLGLTTITTTAAVFGFSGSNTILTFYTIKDVLLRNNYAVGTFIKEFVFFWSGVLRGKAYGNSLVGFGTDSGFIDDVGCYAITAYDFSHGTGLVPSEIEVCDNIIDQVRDCGFYVAGANVITAQNNRIINQTSLANNLLPKGALAINGAANVSCEGNTMVGCAIGITIAQASNAVRCDLFDNSIQGVTTNGTGLWISGTSALTAPAPTINVDGISVQSTASGTRGIHISATSTVGIAELNIQNFDISGTTNGIDLFAPDSTVPAMGNVRIGKGRFRKITGNNIQWLNATNANTRATFDGIDFMELQAGAVVFFIFNAVNLTIRGITFYDMTSGATFCWYGGSAQGRVESVRYVNVAAANRYSGAANELGVITPIFTGGDNDFVQDLNPTELGAVASKYTRQGWQWDRVGAAWKEVRCLTGN